VREMTIRSGKMRFRQAFALAILTAACGSLVAHAATAAVPVCKSGQRSTKAKPCVAAKAAKPVVAPLAPGAKPVPQSQLVTQVADPGDTGARIGATDADTVVHFLDPMRGLYQIEVFNTSGIGYINTFDWVPPPGMTVTAITSTSGGHCAIDGAGAISCTAGGKGIAPPKCTCLAGGSLTVNFTASGNAPVYNGQYWTYYGVVGDWTHITSMTPVPYHIPSFLTPGVDLPICGSKVHPSEKSTGLDPCTTGP
jgi:hypothetical protein